MKAPQQVDTARLSLAPPRPRDAEAMFERYASDPEVTRFLGWPRHRSIDETRAFLAVSDDAWAQWPAGPYLIWSRDNGQLLGATGFTYVNADQAITGYVLAKDAWGQGYATEALEAIVRIAADIGLPRLQAFCHPSHTASMHVLDKCGFVRDMTWSRPTEFPNLAPGQEQAVACYELRLGRNHVA
jgi:ribosomal-protein-alanine N-acetyltransferase